MRRYRAAGRTPAVLHFTAKGAHGVDHGFVWNIDPILIDLGPVQIRYYGLLFVGVILFGFKLWTWQMLRAGYSQEVAEGFGVWAVVAVIVGSRLGHCLFYEPDVYLADPIRILYVWEGGLASHGATIGLILAIVVYARRNGMHWVEALDRFAMSAATGAALVRLGNFFNSEIVGRATDLPWAVRFVRYDGGEVARHPSQLYEFALGLGVLLVLYLADRSAGGEKRPLGLLAGLFFTLYFAGRIGVEFVKEYQVFTAGLTMGQWLSVIPLGFGLWLLWFSRKGLPATPNPIAVVAAPAAETAKPRAKRASSASSKASSSKRSKPGKKKKKS